jgi:hypothetical protein
MPVETSAETREKAWDRDYDFQRDLAEKVGVIAACGGGMAILAVTHFHEVPIRVYVAIGPDSIDAQEAVLKLWERRGEIAPRRAASPWRRTRLQ